MPILRRILLIACAVLTGATFLYSAYTKSFPIQPFEYTLVEFLHLPWLPAAIAARLLIGLEAALGLLMVLHLFGSKKWVLKLAIALLIIFSIYLTALWAIVGNNINCGCFGDAIWMSPAASLIKNGVLLLLTGLLLPFHRGISFRWGKQVTIVLFFTAMALPFVVLAIPAGKPSWLRKDRYKIDLTAMYADTTATPHRKPAANMGRGKYIVAFVSPSCPHCRIAVRKMHLMKVSNPTLPFFLVIGGTESPLNDFWKQTNAQDIPYMRLSATPFMKYTGGIFPTILWLNDGWVDAKADYNTLTQQGIEEWLKSGK